MTASPRGGLAEFVDVPNPYQTKAKTAQAMQITQAGLVELISGE